jgi:hypothetical protein
MLAFAHTLIRCHSTSNDAVRQRARLGVRAARRRRGSGRPQNPLATVESAGRLVGRLNGRFRAWTIRLRSCTAPATRSCRPRPCSSGRCCTRSPATCARRWPTSTGERRSAGTLNAALSSDSRSRKQDRETRRGQQRSPPLRAKSGKINRGGRDHPIPPRHGNLDQRPGPRLKRFRIYNVWDHEL